ncbi:Hypothetical protein ORPV_653, partial [Orpheovirus IHUMI-LCC2]
LKIKLYIRLYKSNMEIIDNILYLTSFIKDCKTLLSISLINKNIYNIIRNNYYKRKIIEAIIGNRYNDVVEHCLSLSFVDMIKALQRVNPNILVIAYTNIDIDRIRNLSDMDEIGNNIIVCDNIIDLIKNLPKVVNVGKIDDSGHKSYTLVIGELYIHDKESSEIKELLRYKILKNKFCYDDVMICGSRSNNYDNIILYWLYSGWYGNQIEFLRKGSRYYNCWFNFNYVPYEGVPTILKEQELTINKIMTKDDKINEDVKIGDLDIKVMNYLLCNIKK